MVGGIYTVVGAVTPDAPSGTHENVAFPYWLNRVAYATEIITSFVGFQLEGVKTDDCLAPSHLYHSCSFSFLLFFFGGSFEVEKPPITPDVVDSTILNTGGSAIWNIPLRVLLGDADTKCIPSLEAVPT